MTGFATGVPGAKWQRRVIVSLAVAGLLLLAHVLRQQAAQPEFLEVPEPEFVALFVAPPSADSLETRRELDALTTIQRRRTAADVEAARADRKTEVSQFAEALGLAPQDMRGLHELADLADQIEVDVRPYVRAAKYRFRRLRPYEVDARLEPCIGDVRGDLSYPSGHATYGYVTAYLLADMVPERRAQLMARAREFARQRVVCGVHFPSDLEAGRLGAEWLAQRFLASPEYLSASAPARRELRAAVLR